MDKIEMDSKNKYGKELDLNNKVEEILKILQESQKNPKLPPSLSNYFNIIILFNSIYNIILNLFL